MPQPKKATSRVTSEARERVLSVSFAAFGFALGIALLPLWLRPAPAGQLPGFMTSAGLDAGASYHFYLGLVALTILIPAVSRRLTARLAAARTWAFVTATAALFFALWTAIAQENLFWVALPTLAVVIACTLLAGVRQRFTRSDILLLPSFLCVFMATKDIAPSLSLGRQVMAAGALVLIVRLALPLIGPRPAIRFGHCFAATAVALALQSHYNGYYARHAGWPSLLIVLLAPFALRFVRGRLARRIPAILAIAIYPAIILAYSSATSSLAAEGKPHADLFEDSHNLTVASEMLRGERPYRDIIPSHGLIQDGLLDYLLLRSGRTSAGRVNQAHGVIGSGSLVAAYAVAACAIGSPDVALLAYFAGVGIGTTGGSVRSTPALIALALIVAGVRRRRPRLFAWSGVMLVMSGLTSLDFALYAAVAAIAGALRMPRGDLRRRALRALFASVIVALVVVMSAMAIAGLAVAFVRTTLFEIATLGPVYSLMPFIPAEALRLHRFPPEFLIALFDRSSLSTVVWCISLVAVAAAWRSRRDSSLARWNDALLVIGVWIVATGTSYAERQHGYTELIAPQALVAVITLLAARPRLWRRVAAAVLTGAVLILAQPSAHLIVLDMVRSAHGPLSADATEVPEIPRARGALYRAADAPIIRSASKYVPTMATGETFFDFTNRGALYFVFNRDCPIRQVEVPFYETEARQREVIETIRANPRIRAALVPREGDARAMVDGVPNSVRAPLVWAYLNAHFRPDFEEGDVVFWRRID